MTFYPIFLDLTKRPCAVVGGGVVAERKVKSLIIAGARVTVISPRLSKGLKELVAKKKITHVKGSFEAGSLKGFFLVISAASAKEVNERVADEAREAGAIVNVVDSPLLCDFLVPSLVSRGDLMIAVSTSGKFPALAKKMRQELEKLYGPEYGLYVELLSAIRNKLLKDKRKYDKKERLFNDLFASDIPGILRSGAVKVLDTVLVDVLGRGYTLARLGVKIKK
ncbi:MAG: bifunctional precorrin-2 dehydrogenase/sirohydrochlorin ferrochelatase [Thermodesulfobacteriota bacterium]